MSSVFQLPLEFHPPFTKLDELKTLFGQEGTTLASFVPVFIMSANERLDDVYKDREIFMNFLKEQTKK